MVDTAAVNAAVAVSRGGEAAATLEVLRHKKDQEQKLAGLGLERKQRWRGLWQKRRQWQRRWRS